MQTPPSGVKIRGQIGGGLGGVLPPWWRGVKKGGFFTLKKGSFLTSKRGHFGAILEGKKGGPRGVKKPGNPAPGRGGGRGGKIGKNRGAFCTAPKIVPISIEKKGIFLSRLGELLNTLENVHPRPPRGGKNAPPRGPLDPPFFTLKKGGFRALPAPLEMAPQTPL